MKTFKKYVDERMMTDKQKLIQIQHYWDDLDHMASDDTKKKSMQRLGYKNIKLDSRGKITSFDEERDYKDEYKKFQSSEKMRKYRSELNKYNREKGTYGNRDGKDASHKDGKIVGMEDQSINRGRAEASRLKGSKRKVEEANSKYIVSMNPSDKKWYVMGHVGSNKWMPVSSGFKNKAQAQKWAKSQDKVDIAARGEMGGV